MAVTRFNGSCRQNLSQYAGGAIDIGDHRSAGALPVAPAQCGSERTVLAIGPRIAAYIMQQVEIGADLQPQVLNDGEQSIRARCPVDREVKIAIAVQICFDISGSI